MMKRMTSPWLMHGLMVLLLAQIYFNFRVNGFWLGLMHPIASGVLWSLIWTVVCFAHNLFTSDSNDWNHFNLWAHAKVFIEVMGFNAERLMTMSPSAWMELALWPGAEALPVNDRIHMNLILFFAYAPALASSSPSRVNQSSAPSVANPTHSDQAMSAMATHGGGDSLIRFASGHINYRAYVDPHSVRNIAVHVASPYAGGEREKILQAAALFEYVKARVNYISDPITMHAGSKKEGDFLASPVDTLQIGGGDCDDQALLMASLLSAVGVENRILFVDSPNNGAHLLTQFAVDASLSDDVATVLEHFYEDNTRVPDSRSYLPFVEGGKVWLMTDTTRDYVGDFSSLVDQGFITQRPDGLFEWHSTPMVF